jgi:hypothetical protein
VFGRLHLWCQKVNLQRKVSFSGLGRGLTPIFMKLSKPVNVLLLKLKIIEILIPISLLHIYSIFLLFFSFFWGGFWMSTVSTLWRKGRLGCFLLGIFYLLDNFDNFCFANKECTIITLKSTVKMPVLCRHCLISSHLSISKGVRLFVNKIKWHL